MASAEQPAVDDPRRAGAPGIAGAGDIDPAEMLSLLGDMVAVALVGGDGRFEEVSDRWCASTGWARTEALGSHWTSIVHPDDLEAVHATAAAAGPGRPDGFVFESRVMARGGAATWTRTEVTPFFDTEGAVRTWLVVFSDIDGPKSAAEALSQSERRLQVIVDSLTDVVTVLEPDGSLRSTNLVRHRLPGAAGGALPEDPRSLIHPDDRATLLRSLRQMVDDPGRPGWVFEHRARIDGGRWRWIETMGISLVDDPAVTGIVVHSRDVTERHEAADELRLLTSRLNTLASNLMAGVVMADEDGQLMFANEAAIELFELGVEPESLMGEDLRVSPGNLGHYFAEGDDEIARMETIARRRQVVREERVRLANGRPVARSFVPILDGVVFYGYLWKFRDLSEEEALAAERERLLEMEREQNARLVELDRLKTDLLVSVSHELRTPLTSIISFTRLLADGLALDTPGEQADFLDIIERNGQRLLRLVDDLLMLERLGASSAIDADDVSLPDLVGDAVASLGPLAHDKAVTLVCEAGEGPLLHGDADRLGQLLDNLLTNALKFTPSGGTVTVVAAPGHGGWSVVVSDTGIGIPPGELDRLFQRFYRASNARRVSAHGSGLGLAIALRIAELHAGTIEAASTEGVGSTFSVRLRGAPRRAP